MNIVDVTMRLGTTERFVQICGEQHIRLSNIQAGKWDSVLLSCNPDPDYVTRNGVPVLDPPEPDWTVENCLEQWRTWAKERWAITLVRADNISDIRSAWIVLKTLNR